ncbi:Dyp-type peroxidase [Vibrio sp.]|nr:Dyp-type peroxidase [Vibrio sp.]
MNTPQSAILPDASAFATYTQIKVTANHAEVLEALQAMPDHVNRLEQQQGVSLYLSIAFSHQFWCSLATDTPAELKSFEVLGQGDIVAPQSDVDILIHLHSHRHDLHFYLLRSLLETVAESIEVIDETSGFKYLDSRDMTLFVDGTENPKDEQRQTVAIVPEGDCAGGSYVMVQRFVHDLPAWNRLNVAAQEKVIGRTKTDSIELDNVPKASHVGRVDLKEEGKGLKILRHSLPYGSASGEHGLLFIAYCYTLHNHEAMLQSMYGVTDGKTDQLLRFTKAVTGAYFFAPSQEQLQTLKVKS